MTDPRPVLVIHGGAGTIARPEAGSDGEAPYHAALTEILAAGERCLREGGSALDAVAIAVDLLEECPLFNAGVGAVFTSAGTHELDAAIMDGATLRAGAVAGLARVRRPGRAARAVMEDATHVLLAGAGAEEFCRAHGLEMVEPTSSRPRRAAGSWRPRRPAGGSASTTTNRRPSTNAGNSAPSARWRSTVTATSRRSPRPAA